MSGEATRESRSTRHKRDVAAEVVDVATKIFHLADDIVRIISIQNSLLGFLMEIMHEFSISSLHNSASIVFMPRIASTLA